MQTRGHTDHPEGIKTRPRTPTGPRQAASFTPWLAATTCTITLSNGLLTIVDADLYDEFSAYRWEAHLSCRGKKFYARRRAKVGGVLANIAMHRYIAGAKAGEQVDHIDGNSLNNVRSNLRICTSQQNACNRMKVTGDLRFKGTTFIAARGKWRAKIAYCGATYHLGDFATELEAAHEYDRAAKKIFGEFALTNFPDGQTASEAYAIPCGSPTNSNALPRPREAATGSVRPAGDIPPASRPTTSITTVRFIRSSVFRMTQAEFATLLGTTQGRVSTWEAEGRFPSMTVMDLVRGYGKALCAGHGIEWSDSWFFEVPDAVPVARLVAAE